MHFPHLIKSHEVIRADFIEIFFNKYDETYLHNNLFSTNKSNRY